MKASTGYVAAALAALAAAFAYTRTAGATPQAPAGAGGVLTDPAHLPARALVTMPGSFHLRVAATAADSGPELPAGTVVRVVAAAPEMVRGPREWGYRVTIERGTGAGSAGFAFVPYNATAAA